MSFQFALNAIRFEDVRAEVVKFLSEQGTYDAAFDFAGSNLSYVIDTMSYTTMLMSYMVSTVANDNFLDTTTLRKNAVSISKTLGYKPKRVQSSRIEGSFVYRPGDVIFSDESKLTISPNTTFIGTDDGYTWVNTEPIVLRVNPRDPFELTSAADPLTPRVDLIQGVWRKFNYLGNGENLQTFNIPSTQIDENNMKVSVYITQDGESGKVEWTFARTFFQITSEEIYFVEEDVVNEGTPRIIFGNGIVGRAPANYETVTVDYLETVADIANGESDVEIPDDIVLNKSFDILTIDSQYLNFEPAATSFGGTPYETLEDIQNNAPRFFAAAGRAVTANDFETLIEVEFGYLVDQVAVFGGDELEPGNRNFLGNSYIAATPASAGVEDNFTDNLQLYLTESSETEIITKLKDAGIIATEKYSLKPTYIYLLVATIIELSSRISSAERDAIQIQSQVVLEDYFDNELNEFAIPFRESKVRSQVDALEQVISTEVDIDYSFVLNKDTFYVNRQTALWLPVRFKRDETGAVLNNEQGYPETRNFIKTNTQIAVDYDAGNQSLIELFRIEVDNNNIPVVSRETTVWHNQDVNGDLDVYWTPTLNSNIQSSTLDLSGAPLIPTGGNIGFIATKNGTEPVIWSFDYGAGSTIEDVISQFDARVATTTADHWSSTSVGAISTLKNPQGFDYYVGLYDATSNDWSIPIAGPEPSIYGDSILDGTNFENALQVWTMEFNEEPVAYVTLDPDRGITVITYSTDAAAWLEEIVEVRSNFIGRDAEPINGIPYNSVWARRWYSASSGRNLLPEAVNGVVRGKTGIHGVLTHQDLDRYLYNNDRATVTVADINIFIKDGNKSLYQETFQFKGAGGQFYSTSLSWSSINEFDQNIYSLYLNNTTSDARKKVATMVWDKTSSDVEQFEFITTEDEAQWLIEQGFEVPPLDGTSETYNAFIVVLDEKGTYSVQIELNPALSNLKIDEKNLLMAWLPGDGTAFTALYNVEDRYTREFTDSLGNKQPIEFTDETGVLTATWSGPTQIDMFTVIADATELTGYSVSITDEDSWRMFGLRTEIRVEPLNLIIEDEFGNVVEEDGFAVYSYGIYHNSVIGTFEYDAGDTLFLETIEGDYLGGEEEQETATIHIREFFDNYGTGEDDVKMDVITITPDNKYEVVDGVQVIVGTESDFDSIFTQTIRADVLPVTSVLI